MNGARPDRGRRRALLKAGAASALTPLAAAAPTARAQQARAQAELPKVLSYAFEVAETGFDPAQITDRYSRIVTAHIFESLYSYDHLARPYLIRPLTATALPEASADYTEFTIRLQPGIFFQDDPAFKGQRRELVAEDYLYSLKRFADPRWKSPVWAGLSELRFIGLSALREASIKQKTPFDYATPIDGMRALDRYTLRFRFEEPRPRFIQTLADSSLFGAVAREVIEAYGDRAMEKPVGTGPFRLAEWRRSSRIVLERNPGYRARSYDAQPNADDAEGQALLAKFKGRRLPMVDRVEIAIIDEEQPRWLSFLNRQLDVLEQLPFQFVNIAAPNGKLSANLARQGVQMYRALASDTTVTVFNMDDPVIGGYTPERVALRRAINLGIDLEQEIRLFWRGQAVPAHSPFSPHTYGYELGFASENGQHSLPRAKALLDLAGYVDRDGDGWREQPDGSPLTLQWATTPDQRARQRDELRRKDMTALGIRVNFVPAKWPENLKNARAGKLMVWSLGYSSAAPDGQPALDRGASVHVGGQNLSRFRNVSFDKAYTAMRSLPDGPERAALMDDAKRLLIAYAPYKYHVHRIITDLAHPWVHGFRRPPYWQHWWSFVDIDAQAKAQATA
jgi:ABC-type transport system substrate-binding protein